MDVADPRFPDPADERLRPAGAVSRMAPGKTRLRPIRERQSVCPIRRVRAGVRKEQVSRKGKLAWRPVMGKRYLTGKSLERVGAQR